MIENFVAVARALQRSKGIPDSEFRVFVGADKRESYEKVGPRQPILISMLLVSWLVGRVPWKCRGRYPNLLKLGGVVQQAG